MKLNRIAYKDLNARQQENYNFQKIAAILADYGYNCLRLTDDWEGADFIACHIDGDTFLKVQLKGELSFAKKYIDKNIWIAFRVGAGCYLCPHDEILKALMARNIIRGTKSWDVDGWYTFPSLPKKHADILDPYKIDPV